MLKSLTIKNVALIDAAQIDFTEGLNILSGETGSGKSVILEALNFVLGAKADKSLIRSGENECSVVAEFDVSGNDEIASIFDDLGIERDDILIVSRRLNVDGKGIIKLNGETLTQSMLKKITLKLVDVHGQSEHFFLLKNANQLELIDKFTDKSNSVKNEIAENISRLKEIDAKLESLGGSDSDRLVKIDILSFQINEIEQAQISEGEEEKLISIRKTLLNQGKIVSALTSVKSALSGDGGADDVVGSADKIMSSISEYGDNYSEISKRISDLRVEITDVADSVSQILDDFTYSEYDPEQIESRLDVIKTLKRKYGGSEKAILDFLEKAESQLDIYKNYNELSAKLVDEKTKLQSVIYELYKKLSNLRRESAENFSKKVKYELFELGMKSADFIVLFNDLPSVEDCGFYSINGKDEISFMFSANAGEPLKPMSDVISGGEISRFMLAVKTQTAKFNNISTFIFDEIDAGISGNTAKIVAQKFAKIAKNAQIIAITHLPQISAMGDNNLLIEKVEEKGKTLTKVIKLDDKGKLNEIVRLTGGEIESASAKQLAKELIDYSTDYKRSII